MHHRPFEGRHLVLSDFGSICGREMRTVAIFKLCRYLRRLMNVPLAVSFAERMHLTSLSVLMSSFISNFYSSSSMLYFSSRTSFACFPSQRPDSASFLNKFRGLRKDMQKKISKVRSPRSSYGCEGEH